MVWSSSDVSPGDDVLAEQYNDLRADAQDVFDNAVPLGSITMWAGGTGDVPSGWDLCDGSAINRTTYSDLFTLIGTTFGAGDGSTTFNVPDMRDRFVIGAGSSYSRNSKGGSNTVDSSHTHTVASHSHSIAQHSHTVSSHTHSVPSHTHGAGSYRAEIYRSSQYNMYLNQSSSGGWTSDTLINLYNSSSNSSGHSNGVVVTGSSSSWGGTSGSSAPGTTTAGATSTGNSSPSTGSGGSSTLENRPPYIGIYFIIKIE